ncbi:hypothetical protein EC973_001443 [Apophysomyces ossiformis]|uniref:Uncharacterized protein n=1 Tax=Apophysomyces ossiformis TaxID=679940 RepID=A0A8H7EPC6_9FUNG|nr:hypothetical protein EC973_001443 [Apophysomyces ossiformis]
MELDLTHNGDEKTIPTTPVSPSAYTDPSSSPLSMTLQFLQATTFSYVGHEFLCCLVREIGQWTQTQTVLVQQLMTVEEYKEMAEAQTDDGSFRFVADDTNQSLRSKHENEPSPSPKFHNRPCSENNSPSSTPIFSNDQVLLNRASYSTSACENIAKNTAIQLPLLRDTPHIQTLLQSPCSIQKASPGSDIYPCSGSFVGIRLDTPTGDSIGLICIMTDKPVDSAKLLFITDLLESVKLRTMRELQRVREEERLMKAKNDAIQDAENKIKFLADMSHEIRLPVQEASISFQERLTQILKNTNECGDSFDRPTVTRAFYAE